MLLLRTLAESEGEGKGSTFRVSLPLMSVHLAPSTPRQREHPLAEPRQKLAGLADLTGVHVLAVDDEEDSLGLLRVVLESAGARVTTATSAATALEVLELIKPDVLVADIGMPEMDGFELIKRVRDRGLPVILISHNMPHVFEIADRIHIQRLGRRAALVNKNDIHMSDAVARITRMPVISTWYTDETPISVSPLRNTPTINAPSSVPTIDPRPPKRLVPPSTTAVRTYGRAGCTSPARASTAS